ncbi:MAG: erythromycin esterase-like protein [Flavobacteriales bacterium]
MLFYIKENPDKKIILWAASGHLTYDKKKVYTRNKMMGEYLKDYFNNAY